MELHEQQTGQFVSVVYRECEEISTCSAEAAEHSTATQSGWKLRATNFASSRLDQQLLLKSASQWVLGSLVDLFWKASLQKMYLKAFTCKPKLWQLVKPVAPDSKPPLYFKVKPPFYNTQNKDKNIATGKMSQDITFMTRNLLWLDNILWIESSFLWQDKFLWVDNF